MRIVFPSNFIIILNVQQYRTESAVVYQSLFRVWLDKIEGFARERLEEIARGSGLDVDVVMARHLFLAAWVYVILKFCAHDQPEKDDSEKRKQQPGKYGWDAPNKEQPNVGGTGGWKRRTQPELIAQHSDCDIIKPRFIEATLI